MALPFPLRLHTPSPTNEAASRAFPATSRYYAIQTASYPAHTASSPAHTASSPAGNDGPIVYLTRRFCPPDNAAPLLALVRVSPGERLDQLTARTLGDPTQFWRVADANHALNPYDLAAPGRVLRVPVPRHTPQP